MWIGAGGFGFRQMGETEINAGVVPIPVGPNSADGSGFQTVQGYFISAETESREACWNWMSFLTDQPNVGSGLPARISVAESDAYRQQVGDEQAEAFLTSINVGSQPSFFQHLMNRANWLFFSLNWLQEAYDATIAEEMTVEEALEIAQAKVDTYRSCIISHDAYQDFEGMQTCAAEVE